MPHGSRNASYKHGRWATPEYRAWRHMFDRCINPKDAYYHRYGGRGIRICDRWRDFQAFLADMGERPSPQHSLDRIDVNGHYEPANCRWATKVQQANNTSTNRFIVIEGRSDSLANWVRLLNINPYDLVYDRIKAGIAPQRALQLQ